MRKLEKYLIVMCCLLVLFFETTAKGRTISKHRKSEIIFSQGDDADAVFYVKKGKVKVTVVSKQGKEANCDFGH